MLSYVQLLMLALTWSITTNAESSSNDGISTKLLNDVSSTSTTSAHEVTSAAVAASSKAKYAASTLAATSSTHYVLSTTTDDDTTTSKLISTIATSGNTPIYGEADSFFATLSSVIDKASFHRENLSFTYI